MSIPDPVATAPALRSRSIIDLTCDEACSFFLKEESYCNIDLPPYFQFNDLIAGIATVLNGKLLSDYSLHKPRDFENINHMIFNNKDGRHAWRPLQLIHPALYVSLVTHITNADKWGSIISRFAEFAQNEKIKCHSLPVISLTPEEDKAEQITHWWQHVEQKSVELSLEFEYIIHTDITDCYGSIYTHSIAWELHTKTVAKIERNNRDYIGNIIDNHIQDMRHGQTNGIPQGSVLMDFIAEMVLSYADKELSEKISGLNIDDYRILRYREDYRIFVNNSQDGDRILKCLTEVMIDLGLKLNPTKTSISNRVITSSFKEDKLRWICQKQSDKSLQKHLLIIHSHSLEYQNAGSLVVALNTFHQRILRLEKYDQVKPLICVVVDIAYHNPRTYPLCAAILSKLVSLLETIDERKSVVEMTKKKFRLIPNTGHMDLWLQRISLPFDPTIDFDEPLCRLVRGESETIWNCDWIRPGVLLNAVDAKKIINQNTLTTLNAIVSASEVAVFVDRAEYDS